MYTHIYIYVTYIYIYIFACVCICLYIYIYTFLFIDLYIYIYIYSIYIYIYITTPTTPQGGRGAVPHPHHTTGRGRGTVLWLTHDHGGGGEGGWNAGPYIRIYSGIKWSSIWAHSLWWHPSTNLPVQWLRVISVGRPESSAFSKRYPVAFRWKPLNILRFPISCNASWFIGVPNMA